MLEYHPNRTTAVNAELATLIRQAIKWTAIETAECADEARGGLVGALEDALGGDLDLAALRSAIAFADISWRNEPAFAFLLSTATRVLDEYERDVRGDPPPRAPHDGSP
jgi:hypothetical protein